MRILAGARLDPALARMLEKVYQFTLMTFGALMAVNQLGVNVGAVLAGLGVVGLTIGFAGERYSQQCYLRLSLFLGRAFSCW